MARIWFVKEGSNPARGYAPYERPLAEIRAAFPDVDFQFLGGPDTRISIGEDSPVGELASPRHVICDVEEGETTDALKAGYYRLGISIDETINCLGTPRPPTPE